MNKLPLIPLTIVLSFMSCGGPSGSGGNSSSDQDSLYTRVNANTNTNATEILELYAYGMAIIKALDCTDPASWYYQGSMHAVPPIDQIKGSTDNLCMAHDTNPSFRGWNSCPHMYPTGSQLNFLTWHRLYVYYYERNIRYHIANGGAGFPGLGADIANQFSLPYWDYTNQALMPRVFSVKSFSFQKVKLGENPLYEIGRSPTLMMNEPIDYQSTDSIAVNVDGTVKNLCVKTMQEALNVQKFLSLPDVSEFSRGLEDRLHNVMHDYIGGAVDPVDQTYDLYNRIYQSSGSGFGLMGQIPSAGFDPIFFLHHSNVDRLFASWEALYGPITIEDMNRYAGTWDSIGHIYQFWDTPANSWVTYSSMQEMLDAAHSINYDYEELATVPQKLTAQQQSPEQTALIHSTVLDQPAVLDSVADGYELSLSEARALDSDGREARYSVEVDLRFGRNMLQQLLVFSLPDQMDWNACDLDPAYVHGVIGVFGSTHPMEHHSSSSHPVSGQEYEHKALFDVTSAIKEQASGKPFKVYVVPLNTENGPDFYLKSIKLYEHH